MNSPRPYLLITRREDELAFSYSDILGLHKGHTDEGYFKGKTTLLICHMKLPNYKIDPCYHCIFFH